MAVHGSIGSFVPDEEDWVTYIERLENYFVANDVAAPKKKATLFSICGKTVYTLVKNLAVPREPGDLSYDEVVKLVKDHYNPKPPVIVQRFKFNTRSQQQGESVVAFVAALREIAQFCDYKTMLDEMIRDRVVCGLSKAHIQKRLLAEPDLDLKKTIELAVGMETAEQNVRDIQTPSAGKVYKLDQESITLCTPTHFIRIAP